MECSFSNCDGVVAGTVLNPAAESRVLFSLRFEQAEIAKIPAKRTSRRFTEEKGIKKSGFQN